MNRRLGNLESSFYEDYKILPGMIRVSCKKPVNQFHIHSALQILVQRHPMLRMAVTEKDGVRTFVEMEDVPINMAVNESSDWKAVSKSEFRPFENNGPLFRFIWLVNDHNTRNNLFQCIFTTHHCISDFPYCYLMIMDFFNILKDLQNGSSVSEMRHLFPPPIEQVLGNTNGLKENVEVPLPGNCQVISALEAYEHFYKDEITSLAMTKRVAGSNIWEKIDKETTEKYLSRCKAESVSNTAAILAACVISFGKLLNRKGCKDLVQVKFVFIVNLRRYMDKNAAFYPGVAVVPCPISVDVDVAAVNSLQNNFWDLARNIKDQMTDAFKDRKPLDVLHRDIANDMKYGRKTGKSENVFTLSNVDTYLFEVNDNFRVVDFQVNADVKVDYQPVFLVVTHVFDGSFHLQVVYSSSYTSSDTAEIFTDNIKTLLQSSLTCSIRSSL